MAKDPAFLFYPGDYLKDTQMLSEKVQVAYDRIMCEHMRNICITQQQLNFLTKRLNEDEVEEIMMVLTKVNGGYQIEWIAESISKRKAYSESRRKNREGKTKEDMNNISKTYDKHMENENVSENVSEIYRSFDHLSITVEQFKNLEKEYHKATIDGIIDSIENYKDNKKYKSLYLTAKKWLKNEPKRRKQL